MTQRLNRNMIRRHLAFAMVAASAVLLSSCMEISNPLARNNTALAAKQVGEAVEADKKARQEEEREFKQEMKEEKEEDKDFERMKRELAADQADAKTHPGETKGVSRLFVDKELMAVNERVHHLSQRMEHLSARVHKMAQHLENLPAKLAELKLELMTTENEVRTIASGEKPARKRPPKKSAPKKTKPFWGIQLGAYKTKPGAKEAWNELLANPMAVELSEAEVHYVASKPLKSGKRLTLIVIDKYPSHKAADGACNDLKGNGLDCVAYRVTR